MSLHHPIRIAEQLSLIDHLSKGRLIVGLGRGTAYNIYEYQGYGIDAAESQARFEEAAEIVMRAWTSEAGFQHRGRFWNLNVPVLRPRPYTKPHPFAIHATASEGSIVELGHKGQPFLMNVQSNETTRHRITAWRAAAQQAGFSETAIAAALDQSWVWRNIVVADTNEEAERIGVPAFIAMHEHRVAMRHRVEREQGLTLFKQGAPRPAHGDPRLLIRGSPSSVARQMAEVAELGVGGVILTFRIGPLTHEQTVRSLTLFMQEVAPQLRATGRVFGDCPPREAAQSEGGSTGRGRPSDIHGHHDELGLRDLQPVGTLVPHHPRLDLERDRAAPSADHLGVAAHHIADLDRLQKAQAGNRRCNDPALCAVPRSDAGRDVHQPHDPTAKDIP